MSKLRLVFFLSLMALMPPMEAISFTDSELYYQNGLNFYFGLQGFTKDVAEGKKWIIRAAEENHPEALSFLGNGYLRGSEGFLRDEKRGVDYFTKGAAGGSLSAQVGLIYCMIEEKGGLQQDEEALKRHLSNITAHDKSGEQILSVAQMYDSAQPGTGRLNNNELRKLFLLAAERGNADAQLILANSYQHGNSFDPLAKVFPGSTSRTRLFIQDRGKAIYWYRKAAQQGQANAIQLLQLYYGINQFEGTGPGTMPETLPCPVTGYRQQNTPDGLPSGMISYRHFTDGSVAGFGTCNYHENNRMTLTWRTTQSNQPNTPAIVKNSNMPNILEETKEISIESQTSHAHIILHLSEKEFNGTQRQKWIEDANHLLAYADNFAIVRNDRASRKSTATGQQAEQATKLPKANRGPRAVLTD